MARRPLDPDEAALWSRVLASVRPMPGRRKPDPMAQPAPVASKPVRERAKPVPPPARGVAVVRKADPAAATLDGSWDRRLARGVVTPDSTIDLHGHTLASAYGELDEGLARAVARGDRVLLLVTGRPPRPESERPHARGAIRAQVTDWLKGSRHADAIAAVRGAHPRHGGAGALYIVLRRGRNTRIS